MMCIGFISLGFYLPFPFLHWIDYKYDVLLFTRLKTNPAFLQESIIWLCSRYTYDLFHATRVEKKRKEKMLQSDSIDACSVSALNASMSSA